MRLALLTLAVSVSAVAADTPPVVKVFREGIQIVTLVEHTHGLASMRKVLDIEHNGKPIVSQGKYFAGSKMLWIRLRSIDGQLTCEKFAWLPDDQTPEDRAAELFKEPCN
jgi:hypothetical protein